MEIAYNRKYVVISSKWQSKLTYYPEPLAEYMRVVTPRLLRRHQCNRIAPWYTPRDWERLQPMSGQVLLVRTLDHVAPHSLWGSPHNGRNHVMPNGRYLGATNGCTLVILGFVHCIGCLGKLECSCKLGALS